jgi:hypothetical protein
MSPLDPDIPPAGEEIHLPGPSIQPFLLAIAITMIVVGLTWKAPLLIGGIVFTILVIAAWIRDARHELTALPAEHR